MALNQFLLLPTWTSLKRKADRRLTLVKFLKFKSSVKGMTVKQLCDEGKDFENVHSMLKVPGKSNQYLVGTNDKVGTYYKKKESIDMKDVSFGVLTMVEYRGYLVAFGWSCPVRLIDMRNDYKIVWECEEEYCYQTRTRTLWCSFSRMIQLCKGQLYFVARDENKLIHVDLNVLIRNVTAGQADKTSIKVLDKNIQDVAVDISNPSEVWWLSNSGDIYIRGIKTTTAHKEGDAEFYCLSKQGKLAVVSSSTWNGSTLELLDHKARHLDTKSVSDEVMRVHQFVAYQLDWIVAGCEYSQIHILAVHNKKMHTIESLNVNQRIRGLICGIIVPDHPESQEFLVYGNKIYSVKF